MKQVNGLSLTQKELSVSIFKHLHGKYGPQVEKVECEIDSYNIIRVYITYVGGGSFEADYSDFLDDTYCADISDCLFDFFEDIYNLEDAMYLILADDTILLYEQAMEA